MYIKKPSGNIFSSYSGQDKPEKEISEDLLLTKNLRIERIVSTGQVTPEGTWYDQKEDEWVLLMSGEAKIKFDDGTESKLIPGDYLHIPAGCRHRVIYTSEKPPAIWLAIFLKIL